MCHSSLNQLEYKLLYAFLFLCSFSVYAIDECGVAVAAGVITCNGDNIPLTDSNPYTSGITYSMDGLTLNVNNAATDIITNSTKALFLTGTGNNDVFFNIADTVTITTDGGINADAVVTKHLGLGAVNINSSANILTQGNDGEGVLGWIANAVNLSSISIDVSGVIETQGINATAVFAYTVGSGSIDINSTADITSAQTFSDAILGWIANTTNSSPIVITAPSGIYNTTGTFSPGIQAYHTGLGSVSIISSATINTSGDGSHGVLASISNADNNQSISVIMNGGIITTSNTENDGVYVDTAGSGVFSVDINTGTILASAKGVHAIARNGGELTMASGVVIDNALIGLAIRNGDRDNDGVDEVAGNIIVNSSAIISGDIVLGLGNDTLNLIGGSISGDIFTDDISSSVADGDDSFNWSDGDLNGSFFGGNGSDTVTISTSNYDGNEIFDGGDDLSITDTWSDGLIFQGVNATIDNMSVLNWEDVTIDDGQLEFLTSLTVGGESATGLDLINNSTLKVSNDFLLTGNLNNQSSISLVDNDAGDTFTLNGNYSSTLGQINLDVVLDDGGSGTDILIITGNTDGSTIINITNINGLGANTLGDGILLIQVNGDSTGTFSLPTPLNINGYEYNLVQVGNNWHLQGIATDVDVSISKELLSEGDFFMADSITYRLTITNNGPATATNIVVTDVMTNMFVQNFSSKTCSPINFPCTIPSLDNGESETIVVIAGFNSPGVFDNVASITSDQVDLLPANNSDTTDNNGIVYDPDMSITINNCVAPLSEDQNLIYEITISNEGDYAISGVNYYSQSSQYLAVGDWSCLAFNGAICPAASGNGDINFASDFVSGSSLTFLVSAQVSGIIGNFVNSIAQVVLPFTIPEMNTANNFAQDIDTILDLIFGNGFDCKAAGS